ncbi:MerR family transcriptional regulator [Allobaculum stercoricanis]|uniref:MerR family transcriptional regulator n=1 Tax=Allobaculum stercoricanis TaxID=174709 RepID=UPI0029426E19|nr:MerR family transcriptional regulator [Allobaculum stercoricanis]
MYSMKDVCKLTGMKYETLKYYCNEGLVPNIKRNDNNYRVFDEKDVAWIESLSCLKRCGMGIAEMKEYVDLCLEGKNSIPERKIILDQKKKSLEEKLQEVQECIEYINSKQQFYDDVLSGKIKYKSNLILIDKD